MQANRIYTDMGCSRHALYVDFRKYMDRTHFNCCVFCCGVLPVLLLNKRDCYKLTRVFLLCNQSGVMDKEKH